MGFGIDLNIKVEVPKVDVVSELTKLVDGAKSTATQAIDSAASAVEQAGQAVKSASIAAAGAIAEVPVSFTGAIEDLSLEPHLQLDANASFGETRFEKGPVWILVDLTPEEAKECCDRLRLFSTANDYDETKAIRDFVDSHGETVAILFTDVPMSRRYSLEVLDEDPEPTRILENVPYGELRKTSRRFLSPDDHNT